MKDVLKLKTFYNFFLRLSKREKFIFAGAAFFISLMLLDRSIINPIFSKIESLDREAKERESEIRRDMRILSQKDRILSESAKYAPFIGSLKFGDEDIASLLKEIEGWANKSSVYLIDLKPGGTKDMGSFKKYLISLNCEAQAEQLTEFMYNIENSSRLLTIEKFQLNPKSRESSVIKCNMSISKIAMP